MPAVDATGCQDGNAVTELPGGSEQCAERVPDGGGPAESDHKHLTSDAAYVIASRVIGIGATMAAHMLVSRSLGPAQYGQFVFLTTVIALGSVIAMRGLNEAGVRFVAQSLAQHQPALADSILKLIGRLLLSNSVVVFAVAALSMSLFHLFVQRIPQPAWLIGMACTGMVVLAWQQVTAELLRGYGDLRLASLYSGGQAGGPVSNSLFLVLFAILACYYSRISLPSTLLLLVLSILVTVPIALRGLWTTSQRHLALDGSSSDDGTSRHWQREMTGVGTILMWSQILAFGTYQFDIWLGARMLEPTDLGLYTAAKRLVLLVQLPLQMAMMTVLPRVPRLIAQNRSQSLEKLLRSTASYAAFPALTAILALLLFPNWILSMTFGAEYTGAAPIVFVMIVGHVVMILVGNPPYIMAMTGQQRLVIVANFIAAGCMVLFGLVGARLYGGVGLAIGCAASLIAQHGVLWWMARQRLGIWTHVGRPILPDWISSRATSAE